MHHSRSSTTLTPHANLITIVVALLLSAHKTTGFEFLAHSPSRALTQHTQRQKQAPVSPCAVGEPLELGNRAGPVAGSNSDLAGSELRPAVRFELHSKTDSGG